MPTLILTSNNAANPQTLDLSKYLNLQADSGIDPADPAFSNRIWTRSLLKPGAQLSMEQMTEKETTWPLLLNAVSQTALQQLVTQINQIIETPGAVASWQDDGSSQPTYFDLLSGLLEIQYNYREAAQHWLKCNLRLFSQPLGRAGASRPYAAASGVGPLLMISPYASGGALSIGASTQAGVAGYGGVPAGVNTGIFYPGAPSLAGDAPAQLRISYVGPLANGATTVGVIPYTAVSLLPDSLYRPLVTSREMITTQAQGAVGVVTDQTGVASSYLNCAGAFLSIGQALVQFEPLPVASYSQQDPSLTWAGQHRLFAIARASHVPGYLYTVPNSMVQTGASVTVPVSDWGLYDLGTFTIRPSELPAQPIMVGIQGGAMYGNHGSGACDLGGLVMLPDNATWFLSPGGVYASSYGWPSPVAANVTSQPLATAPYTNTLLLDDVVGDQFLYSGPSQTFAPSPAGSVASSARITPYTRGVIPAPDPKNGLPIIALLGVGQNFSATQAANPAYLQMTPGASWANPQNLQTMARVDVLERTRYVLP